MAHGKFGTAINCMDGRVQLPVINWVKGQFHVDYVDMITEPGPDKALVAGQREQLESIRTRALISVKAHGSSIIVVAGHYDCAGNPVEPEQHQSQLRDAIRVVRSWDLPLDKVVALWIGKDWSVEVVASE